MQSLNTDVRYLVEVKAGKGIASTAKKALQHGKGQKLLYLKGDTKGGVDNQMETVPIYMLEQYVF